MSGIIVMFGPDVLAHIRSHGVLGMEIFRLGRRLTMVMETDGAVFSASAMERAAVENDVVRRWEGTDVDLPTTHPVDRRGH